MKQRVICGLLALVLPLVAQAGVNPSTPAVVLAECATSEAALSVAPNSGDDLNGLLAVMQNVSPWHPANTNPADQEPALTDGTGLNGLAGLLNDFPGEGTPAAIARWDLGGLVDLSSLTVFSGNAGRDGRVFHHYDVYVTSASPADSGYNLLISQVISAPFGSVNSGTFEACVTSVADASGGFLAEGITGLEIHFYAVDNTGGQFRDQWDPGNPNDSDGLTFAFVSPLITEVDAYFVPALIETPTETPTEEPTATPTETNTPEPPTPTPTPIQCVQAATLTIKPVEYARAGKPPAGRTRPRRCRPQKHRQ